MVVCWSGVLHAKCSQAVKQAPKVKVCSWAWPRNGGEKKCEVKLVVCLLTGSHWGAWIFIVSTGNWFLGAAFPLSPWLTCQSPTYEVGWTKVEGKIQRWKRILCTLLRACQFAEPTFLKATLNSNPPSLIPGSNTWFKYRFWIFMQRRRMDKRSCKEVCGRQLGRDDSLTSLAIGIAGG